MFLAFRRESIFLMAHIDVSSGRISLVIRQQVATRNRKWLNICFVQRAATYDDIGGYSGLR